jgi:hypothetical protein
MSPYPPDTSRWKDVGKAWRPDRMELIVLDTVLTSLQYYVTAQEFVGEVSIDL